LSRPIFVEGKSIIAASPCSDKSFHSLIMTLNLCYFTLILQTVVRSIKSRRGFIVTIAAKQNVCGGAYETAIEVIWNCLREVEATTNYILF